MSVKFYFTLKKPKAGLSPSFPKDGLFFKGKNGSTVILIHGLTGTPHEMRFLANSLNKAGYSVICPRLAKHGEPLEILKHAKWQEFYETVRQTLLQIDTTVHPGPIFVSGLSMGALLGLLLAEEFPDRIAGVSCLSPTLFYDGWNTPWSRYLLPLAYYTPIKEFFYFKEEPPYGIKNPAIRELIHRYYEKATINNLENVAKYGYPYFPVKLLCQLLTLVKYLNKKLPNIHTPVQLIQAEEDDMTSMKNSEFIRKHIRSEIKELILLFNSYHIITADQERDKVAHHLEDFFNRIRNKTYLPAKNISETNVCPV